MKRWLPLSIIILAGIAAVIAAQWQRVAARPSADALLSAAADAQHELTRVPAHLDPMSDADEISLGDQLASSYTTEWPLTPEKAVAGRATESYLQTIGMSVASHARRKLPWKFHYIPNAQFVNAFALPGGHIFVGQGLLSLMHSEDALAAVLGHEVEHVDLRHCSERAQTEAHLRNLGVVGALAGLPVEIFEAGYSKEQELEADRDGTTLAINAGYSPLGILQLLAEFKKLEDQFDPGNDHKARTPIGEAAQLSLGTLSGYFRSHPPADERMQQIQQLRAAQHWRAPALRPLHIHDL